MSATVSDITDGAALGAALLRSAAVSDYIARFPLASRPEAAVLTLLYGLAKLQERFPHDPPNLPQLAAALQAASPAYDGPVLPVPALPRALGHGASASSAAGGCDRAAMLRRRSRAPIVAPKPSCSWRTGAPSGFPSPPWSGHRLRARDNQGATSPIYPDWWFAEQHSGELARRQLCMAAGGKRVTKQHRAHNTHAAATPQQRGSSKSATAAAAHVQPAARLPSLLPRELPQLLQQQVLPVMVAQPPPPVAASLGAHARQPQQPSQRPPALCIDSNPGPAGGPTDAASNFLSNPWAGWFLPPAAAPDVSAGVLIRASDSGAMVDTGYSPAPVLADVTHLLNRTALLPAAKVAAVAGTSSQPEQQLCARPPKPGVWAADFGHLDTPQLDQEAPPRGSGERPAALRQQRQQWRQTWVGDYGHLEGPRSVLQHGVRAHAHVAVITCDLHSMQCLPPVTSASRTPNTDSFCERTAFGQGQEGGAPGGRSLMSVDDLRDLIAAAQQLSAPLPEERQCGTAAALSLPFGSKLLAVEQAAELLTELSDEPSPRQVGTCTSAGLQSVGEASGSSAKGDDASSGSSASFKSGAAGSVGAPSSTGSAGPYAEGGCNATGEAGAADTALSHLESLADTSRLLQQALQQHGSLMQLVAGLENSN